MTQRVVNYTYGTGNPVLPNGSIDVRDGIDNLQSFDIFMNADEDTYNQRDGDIVRTVSGMNNEFDAQILNMGFTRVGTFAAGATLTNPRQTLLWDLADGGDGQEYGWSGTFPKVVPALSTPASTGGIAVGAWISRFDPELRGQVMELYRRSYAEAGYDLIGTFSNTGLVVDDAADVVLWEPTGVAYAYSGALPHTIGAGETPVGNPSWVGKAAALLRDNCALTIHAEDFRNDSNGVARSDADTLIAVLDYVVSHSTPLLPYEGSVSNGIAIDLGGKKYACDKVVKQTGGWAYGQVVFHNGCITWAAPLTAQSKVMEIGQASGYVYGANFENVVFLQCQIQYTSALSCWVHGRCAFIDCVDPIVANDNCHEIYVNGNLFRTTGGMTANLGISFPADCRADGNVFVGYDTAIRLRLPSNIISGNHFYGCRVGVKEDYSAGQNQIIFNQFDGCTLESDNSCGAGLVTNNIFYAQSVYYAILVNPKPGFTSHVPARIVNNTFNFFNEAGRTPIVGGTATVSGNTITATGFNFTSNMVGAVVSITDANGAFTNLAVITAYTSSTIATITKVKGFSDGNYTVSVRPNGVCYHTPVLPNPAFTQYFVVNGNNNNNGITIDTGSIVDRVFYQNPALDDLILNGRGLSSNAFRAFKATNLSGFQQYADSTDFTTLRAWTKDGLNTWMAVGYESTDNAGDGCILLRGGKSNDGGVYKGNNLGFMPQSDNGRTLGGPSNRWAAVYAGTGTINTSDAEEKTAPLSIDDAVLDAWADVQLITFQWLESIRVKGEDARWHFGVIAQQVRDAFAAHGLDGTRYGLLCYDEWVESISSVPDGEDENGVTVYKEVINPAGNRWGIRVDQCLFVEAAWQRRNYERQQETNAALKDENTALAEMLQTILARIEVLEAK